jgi:Protein of unknown function (DUF2370)
MTASADSAPSYWETTVHAPSALDLNGDMIIDELPTGSVLMFAFTTLISWSFQLPGFLLTYLLHGTHAGRFGSLAGLALTFIQWGFGATVMGAFPPSEEPPSRPDDFRHGHHGHHGHGSPPSGLGGGTLPADGSLPPIEGIPGASEMLGNSTMGGSGNGTGPMLGDMRGEHEWVSFVLMTFGPPLFFIFLFISSTLLLNTKQTGWFLLLTCLIGYFRVKRFELSVRASRTNPLSAEDIQQDAVLRRNVEDMFGITIFFESQSVNADRSSPQTANRWPPRRNTRTSEEERLENDLRDAGLL